jgi:hypothetical protein
MLSTVSVLFRRGTDLVGGKPKGAERESKPKGLSQDRKIPWCSTTKKTVAERLQIEILFLGEEGRWDEMKAIQIKRTVGKHLNQEVGRGAVSWDATYLLSGCSRMKSGCAGMWAGVETHGPHEWGTLDNRRDTCMIAAKSGNLPHAAKPPGSLCFITKKQLRS